MCPAHAGHTQKIFKLLSISDEKNTNSDEKNTKPKPECVVCGSTKGIRGLLIGVSYEAPYCEKCYPRCRDCKSEINVEYKNFTSGEKEPGNYCKKCIEDCCCDCGTITGASYHKYDDGSGGMYCDRCFSIAYASLHSDN